MHFIIKVPSLRWWIAAGKGWFLAEAQSQSNRSSLCHPSPQSITGLLALPQHGTFSLQGRNTHRLNCLSSTKSSSTHLFRWLFSVVNDYLTLAPQASVRMRQSEGCEWGRAELTFLPQRLQCQPQARCVSTQETTHPCSHSRACSCRGSGREGQLFSLRPTPLG